MKKYMEIKCLIQSSDRNQNHKYSDVFKLLINYLNNSNKYKELGLTVLGIDGLIHVCTTNNCYYTVVIKVQNKNSISNRRLNIEEELMKIFFRWGKLERIKNKIFKTVT